MNVNTRPFFSIIIATFNAARCIEEAIKSILFQKGDVSFELIVKDGKSTDETMDILSKYKQNISYLESSPDLGIYDAWNKALVRACGEWIYFMGADDYFFDDKTLKNVFECLKFKSNSYVAYGMVNSIDVENKLCSLQNEPSWAKLKTKFLQFNCLHHQGVFHNKQLFLEYGTFDITFKVAGDYDLLLRYLRKHDPIKMDFVIAYAAVGGVSTNFNNQQKTILEFLSARRKYGDNSFGRIWLFNYLKGYLKILIRFVLGGRILSKFLLFYRKYNNSNNNLNLN